MRNGSLSGLDLLKGPPWCSGPLDALLVSVVPVAAPSDDKALRSNVDIQWSVRLPDALVMSSGFAAFGGHVDVRVLRPC